MSSGRRAPVVLAWIWTGLILVGGVAVVLTIDRGLLTSEGYVILAATVLYAVLGLLIAIRQPENGIGWLLLLIATGSVTTGSTLSMVTDSPPDPVTFWDVLAIIWNNTGYFFALLIPLLLLAYIFPTGRFLSRWWSLAGWAAGVAVAALLFSEVFTNDVGPPDADWTVENPLGFHDLGVSEGPLGVVFGIILLPFLVFSSVADLPWGAGLATRSVTGPDVVADPLAAAQGVLTWRSVAPAPELLARYAVASATQVVSA